MVAPDVSGPGDDALERHRRTAELLFDELGVAQFADPRYLRWLYEENPAGAAIEGHRDLDGRRGAHFAALPQIWRTGDRRESFVFSLNAITRADTRGRGWFVELGREIYDRAAAEGHVGILTLCNANSTPALTGRLHQRFRGPLPVKVCVASPFARTDWSAIGVTPEYLSGDEFAALAAELDDHEATGWTQCWTRDALRWRLARPTADYTLHLGPRAVAVSTTDSVAGVRVALVLKILPRRGETGLDGGEAIGAACRHHRTPLCIYAGFNAHARVRGIPVPVRLRPSPLNQLFGSLSPSVPESGFTLDTFEFLDSDDY